MLQCYLLVNAIHLHVDEFYPNKEQTLCTMRKSAVFCSIKNKTTVHYCIL